MRLDRRKLVEKRRSSAAFRDALRPPRLRAADADQVAPRANDIDLKCRLTSSATELGR